ncbi:putative membrane protein [Aspergillus saccharolyticus JOP 1030-1]|uniref:Very-long-chain (3R)-3-hydroxyacyl-CoA dehydratase n=1 Tax=Aspergillus saccharolyticus JOP 1030-1 TaxID=1450539 RepID=A0A318Z8B3_9EURO|nr:PTPLA-domain-containing protein [Aspergillus saccharolyticus JOP 1030-1]PYH43565.1 PTPLA-domain-containing protein [Aspergillus saccharolyticus JOP 1030-1]
MSLKNSYLLIYNTINALLWTRILFTLLSALFLSAPPDSQTIYTTLEPWTRWTQTLAALEIVHSALDLTRAPIFTTFTQIFARTVQVWAINYAYPEATISATNPMSTWSASSLVYPAMLFAWSLADAIRYTYFAVLSGGGPQAVPGSVKWLRYSLFLGLYPIGIASEWVLMFRATLVADHILVKAIFVFFLGLYAPGSVMMYKYMVKQRRKVLFA